MKARFVYTYRGANLYGEWIDVAQDNIMHPADLEGAVIQYVQFQKMRAT